MIVVRVHPNLLQTDEMRKNKHIWEERYESIDGLEKHLHRNNTRIVKIFLHLSAEEQRKRLLSRIDVPDKNWKFSLADIQERQYWDKYVTAYEDCLSHTSTTNAPWYIVPADDKKTARLIISQILVETLEGLDMEYPKVTAERKEELKVIRKELTKS